MMKSAGARKRRPSWPCLVVILLCAAVSLVLLAPRSIDSRAVDDVTPLRFNEGRSKNESDSNLEEKKSIKKYLDSNSEMDGSLNNDSEPNLEIKTSLKKKAERTGSLNNRGIGKMEVVAKRCATVGEMGVVFERGFEEPSLRVRRMIREHFQVHGAARVRSLPPEQFCRSGFVIGKAFQAGFGNEMYKILTGAALSIILNRSLIIGQTRGEYPFGNYISYTSHAFTLEEVKHLWYKNHCAKKYGIELVVRIDDFQNPAKSGVLCSNWIQWKQPIIWFQGTTDGVAAQFFLKSVHLEMRKAATSLFGDSEKLDVRPNVFGELLKVLIYPKKDVVEAVNWILKGGSDPDISLHMRMLMNKSPSGVRAALNCLRKAVNKLQGISKPRVVLLSDSPSFIKEIRTLVAEFAEVLYFNYEHYRGNISNLVNGPSLDFRSKDWGPAPRWVAFVDFFLASRAKSASITGAHRRVGTTYAQLISALAAANRLEDYPSNTSFAFLSSFQSNILSEGLKNQIGWGHAWNRFAGPLSCPKQADQCAFTPLMSPAWWDGSWQSPIPRDIRRLQSYGIRLSDLGKFDEHHLLSFCKLRKNHVVTTSVGKL